MQQAVKAFIQQSWESVDADRFPGPQPVSIERRHFVEFRKREYFVCEKTDGVRHMLVSCEHDGKRVAHLVNRAFAMTPVCTMIPRGTILDGELVDLKAGGKPVFLVYDAVVVKGVDVRRTSLVHRLEAARALLKSVIRSTKDPFEIRIKTMMPLRDFASLPPLDSFPWVTDGLVFTPVPDPIRMGTHETLFKWKPRDRITIDFLVRNGRELFVQDRGAEYKEAELNLHNRVVNPDGSILECGYGDLGWFVEKIRTDKTYPNNRRTYFRTLVNIRENIQLSEFVACT
jgi:hypothetical protein